MQASALAWRAFPAKQVLSCGGDDTEGSLVDGRFYLLYGCRVPSTLLTTKIPRTSSFRKSSWVDTGSWATVRARRLQNRNFEIFESVFSAFRRPKHTKNVYEMSPNLHFSSLNAPKTKKIHFLERKTSKCAQKFRFCKRLVRAPWSTQTASRSLATASNQGRSLSTVNCDKIGRPPSPMVFSTESFTETPNCTRSLGIASKNCPRNVKYIACDPGASRIQVSHTIASILQYFHTSNFVAIPSPPPPHRLDPLRSAGPPQNALEEWSTSTDLRARPFKNRPFWKIQCDLRAFGNSKRLKTDSKWALNTISSPQTAIKQRKSTFIHQSMNFVPNLSIFVKRLLRAPNSDALTF